MRILYIAVLSCIALSISAQDLAYGFRAGMNFSAFSGPKETGSDGTELEEFKFDDGFHIGVGVVYKLTDHFGLRGEVLYSQKGGTWKYDGPSYAVLPAPAGTQDIIAIGTREQTMSITNAYVDVPLWGYARFGTVEFSAGLNVAVLVGSSAGGELVFDGVAGFGNTAVDFSSDLDFKFLSDGPREADLTDATTVNVDGVTVSIPRTIGAYYEYTEDYGNFFNTLDIGLNAGISLYLNEGLFVGFRANYGLTDVTANDYDRSLQTLENGSFISRSDTDRNVTLQGSIGFSF